MKIKITSFDTIYTTAHYGIEIGAIYDVHGIYECGKVSIIDGMGKPLVIHPGEYEVIE